MSQKFPIFLLITLDQNRSNKWQFLSDCGNHDPATTTEIFWQKNKISRTNQTLPISILLSL